jgi:hypothetical protein
MKAIKLATKNGYVWSNELQKLVSYKFLWAEFNTDVEDKVVIKYHAVVGGVELDVEVPYKENLKVYENENAFKIGRTIPLTDTYVNNNAMPYDDNGDGMGCATWIFQDGRARRVSTNDITLRYDGIYHATPRCYATEQDVYKHNDFTLVDEEGNERVVKSLASRMALTEEQKDLMQQMKDLVQQMVDSGLRFVGRVGVGDVAVVNANDINLYGSSYYSDYDGCENIVSVDEFEHKCINLYSYKYDEDCLFVDETIKNEQQG